MKTKLFKLTDEDSRTYGGMRWGENVTHRTSGEGLLCGPGWLHAYEDALLAVFLNPMHADFPNPQLWEAEGIVGLRDHGLKVGCTELTTIRQIDIPVVTIEQQVAFGILCAMEVSRDEEWKKWAAKWLSGEDRSWDSIVWSMESAARAAARAAERLMDVGLVWRASTATIAVERAALQSPAPLNLPDLARKAVASGWNQQRSIAA